MSQSMRFRKFENRLKQLRRHFLPITFSLTGDYSARQLDMATAYVLLCHAEIENHIEDAAREVLIAKVKESKAGVVNLTALTLLAYHRTGWEGLLALDDESEPSNGKVEVPNPFGHPLGKLLDDALSEYMARLHKKNHGVRTENLHRLLKPVGIDFSLIDEAWLAAMDGFGQARGFAAHKSAVGVTRPIDPKDEFDRIELILVGLRELDVLLSRLMKSKK